MAKYRLLTRIGDNRDELQWNNYNIDKYIEPPILLHNKGYDEFSNTLLSLYSDNKQVSYITSFKRSINPPSDNTNTVRIDDNSETPIYAWLNDELDSDILYYTQADKIIVKYANGLFYRYSNCTIIDVDIFDTSNVTDMGYMFNDCSLLTSLDLSNFNTSNVTNTSFMFGYCSSLTSLDLSNFDTSSLTPPYDVSYIWFMFSGCDKLSTIICTEETEQWIRNNATTIKIDNIDNIIFNRPSL